VTPTFFKSAARYFMTKHAGILRTDLGQQLTAPIREWVSDLFTEEPEEQKTTAPTQVVVQPAGGRPVLITLPVATTPPEAPSPAPPSDAQQQQQRSDQHPASPAPGPVVPPSRG